MEAYSASALDELCRNKLHVFHRKTHLVPIHERVELLLFVVAAESRPRTQRKGWRKGYSTNLRCYTRSE